MKATERALALVGLGASALRLRVALVWRSAGRAESDRRGISVS